MKIPIEVSARHIHISKKDFLKLYGKNSSFNKIKHLSQPGEFASGKFAVFVNGKNKIENVRIVGPFRDKSQAEISLTDAYKLKLNPLPKIVISGDLSGTGKIIIKNPKNKKQTKIPVIIAQRHLHCSEEDSKKLKLRNHQKISVEISGKRETIFKNVVVRVSPNFKTAVHIDTDEGNSAGINGKAYCKIIKN